MSRSSFRAYVDESGDEGFVFNPDGSGSRRWLVLSAVVVRTRNDLRLVELLKAVRRLLGKQPTQQHKNTALGCGVEFWPEDLQKLKSANPHLAWFAEGAEI